MRGKPLYVYQVFILPFVRANHFRLALIFVFLYPLSLPRYSLTSTILSFIFIPHRLTGFGIHHCFAKSLMGHEVKMSLTNNFYADYYTMAGITLASCLAMCPIVGFLGRRGGLLLFMILTALASLLQLGLLNCEWRCQTALCLLYCSQNLMFQSCMRLQIYWCSPLYSSWEPSKTAEFWLIHSEFSSDIYH